MRTINATYSSQILRTISLFSKTINGYQAFRLTEADFDLKVFGNMKTWKTRKASIQSGSNAMNAAIKNVINLTPRKGVELVPSCVGSDVSRSIQLLGKSELREREMKDVLGNICKYAITALFSLSMVMGQGAPKLDIQIEDQKVNKTQAEMQDASLVTYIPGDTIRYELTASNSGNALMKNPEIIDPIPAGVTYVAGSAEGQNAEITFSIDQGSTYMAWPPFYTVRNSKGILVKREATPEMISHIKWNISKDFKPGESSGMEFLVVVNK